MKSAKPHFRKTITISVFVLFVIVLSLWLLPRLMQPATNLLIISIDTLRADHISCYGYKKNTTPNIDFLASQSHRFKNAYTTMPTTLPAHASLFTSLYPTQLNIRRNGEKVPAEVTTLAEILKSSGYTTTAFVSAVVLDERYGISQGFETYEDNFGKYNQQTAGNTLAKTVSWLKNHNNDPFFLFVHFYDPHTPYYAPDPFRKKFQAPNRPQPPELEFLQNPGQYTPVLVKQVIAAYDASVAYADWAVGKLLHRLEQLGLDENTLVVLISDHGESLDELITRYGYAFDHGEFLYVHELRIPLIVRMPEAKSQRKKMVHSLPVSIVDIMPTILELLHIEPPELVSGRSFLPVLYKEKISPQPIFSERRTFKIVPKPYLKGNSYSIIEDNWHLIFSTNRNNEFYDMAVDPYETSPINSNYERALDMIGKLQIKLKQIKPMFGPTKFETNKESIERLRSLGYIE